MPNKNNTSPFLVLKAMEKRIGAEKALVES
jgi:hypothetical protein